MDVSSIRIVARLEGPSNIEQFHFNPANSNEIAGTFSKENCLFLLHIDRREMDMISNEHRRHNACAFSPDGHHLAYEESGHMKIADLRAKTAIPYQIAKDAGISSIIYSKNGEYIVYSSTDGIYCMHTTHQITWKIISDAKDKIIKFCGDSYKLIMGSSSTGKGMLQSMDFSYTFDHTNHDIEYASLSHDGKLVAYLNKDMSLYVTDTGTRKTGLVTEFRCRPCFKTKPILFSRSDRYIASLLTDGSIYVHDLQTNKNFHSKTIKEDGFNDFIHMGHMPEDSMLLYIENENAIAAIIDEYVCIWHYRKNEYNIRRLDFQPDNIAYNSKNNVLFMVKGYEKGICCKWFLSEDRIEYEELTNARASEDWIISENDRGYSFYNIRTEVVRQADVIGYFRNIAVSPDGKYAALESPFSLNIVIINLETGKEWSLERYSDSDITPFVKIYFEESGHVLVSSCDTSITRWFLETGEKISYKNAEHISGTEHKAATIEKGTLKITSNAPIQDMIDKTRELFKDREFTEEEKQTFYLSDI